MISSFTFDDRMSALYTLKITCHGAIDVAMPELFSSITFKFNHVKISGMLTSITRHEDAIKQRWDYVLEIRPRLYALALRRNINLYPNKSISDIIQALLQNARAPYTNLITDSLFVTPCQRLEISYADNNFEYLQALTQYGIRFYFEETATGEQVVFVDALYKLTQHSETLFFHPDKQEDVCRDQPLIYRIEQQQKYSQVVGRAIFYDPKAVKASLSNMMHSLKSPNDKIANMSGQPLLWMSPCYSPPDITQSMSNYVHQLKHANDHCYKLHSYYSGLRAGQRVALENITGFIEAVKLSGQFEHGTWHFDSIAVMRHDHDRSWLGPCIQRLPLPATLTGAEIQSEDQVSNIGEFKVKFPKRFLTDANNDPWVSFRDLQATSTSAGGASHSMSGTAEVMISSQNGASYDWIILGSLDNNERPSNINAVNYHESRMNTSGGVNVHLRHQDLSNPYSEINMSVQDTQQHPAGINLGSSLDLLKNNPQAHGIQEVSSGYGKRAIMGNVYHTVGSVDNPVQQSALVQDAQSGLTSLTQQVNISGSGMYLKRYYATRSSSWG
jgi:hypothetical protein